MNNAEAIAAVKGGGRCETSTTIFGLKPEVVTIACQHYWRPVACDFETDVLECSRCGRQRLARCNFDDDMA